MTVIILNDKTKSLLTSWKLGSIRNSKHLFCTWFVVLGRYLFQLIVLLKLDSNCLSSFTLSWVDKVTTGTQSFPSVILIWFWFYAAPAARIHSLDHLSWRLISQLIKDISSALQKLLRYFNGIIISTFFVPPFPVCLVICCLNLNEILLLLLAGKPII